MVRLDQRLDLTKPPDYATRYVTTLAEEHTTYNTYYEQTTPAELCERKEVLNRLDTIEG